MPSPGQMTLFSEIRTSSGAAQMTQSRLSGAPLTALVLLERRDGCPDDTYFFGRARRLEPEERRRPLLLAPEPAALLDAGELDRAEPAAVVRDFGDDGFGFAVSGKDLPFGVSASKRRAKAGSFAYIQRR